TSLEILAPESRLSREDEQAPQAAEHRQRTQGSAPRDGPYRVPSARGDPAHRFHKQLEHGGGQVPDQEERGKQKAVFELEPWATPSREFTTAMADASRHSDGVSRKQQERHQQPGQEQAQSASEELAQPTPGLEGVSERPTDVEFQPA